MVIHCFSSWGLIQVWGHSLGAADQRGAVAGQDSNAGTPHLAKMPCILVPAGKRASREGSLKFKHLLLFWGNFAIMIAEGNGVTVAGRGCGGVG